MITAQIKQSKKKKLKEKVHTTDEFRLACQTKANGDITVRRLVLNKEDIKRSVSEEVSLVGWAKQKKLQYYLVT